MSAYPPSQLSEYSSLSPIINNTKYKCVFFLCVRIFSNRLTRLVSRILEQSHKTTPQSSKLTKSYDRTSYRILKWPPTPLHDVTWASLLLKLPTNRLFVQCPVQANDRNSVLLAHRVNSHRKGPVMRKAFPYYVALRENEPTKIKQNNGLPFHRLSRTFFCCNVVCMLRNMASQSSRMMRASNGNIFRVTGPCYKGQWRRTSMFSLICAWTNGCANNRYAGDLRRHCAHYDVKNTYSPWNKDTCVQISTENTE